MERVINFLKQNVTGAFATIENGKPRVRPWGFIMEEDKKFYFVTANIKNVYKQLQENPYAEFTSTSKEMISVRLSGEVIFIKDLLTKQKVLDRNVAVKGLYKSAENPIFEVFYIEHGEAMIADFSGQPPTVISF